MSDAIRCGQCRWWMGGEDEGTCELGPPHFRGGNPFDVDNWLQPQTEASCGCSHGKPKSGSTITVTLTEEKLLPRRFEEET